jgi:hypothetical protein
MEWSCLSPSTSHLAIKRFPGIAQSIERLLISDALCHLLLIDLLDVSLNRGLPTVGTESWKSNLARKG